MALKSRTASAASTKRARLAPKKTKKRRAGRPASNGTEKVGKEALVAITCEMLKTMPPHQITAAEVAKNAGVDPSLIRYYFPDLHGLLVTATEQLAQSFSTALSSTIADARRGGIDPILARVDALFALENKYPFFNRLIREEVVFSRLPEAQALLDRLTRRAVDAYRTALREGSQAGNLREVNPLFLHIAVIGLTATFVTMHPILEYAKRQGIASEISAEAYLEFLHQLLVRGLAKGKN